MIIQRANSRLFFRGSSNEAPATFFYCLPSIQSRPTLRTPPAHIHGHSHCDGPITSSPSTAICSWNSCFAHGDALDAIDHQPRDLTRCCHWRALSTTDACFMFDCSGGHATHAGILSRQLLHSTVWFLIEHHWVQSIGSRCIPNPLLLAEVRIVCSTSLQQASKSGVCFGAELPTTPQLRHSPSVSATVVLSSRQLQIEPQSVGATKLATSHVRLSRDPVLRSREDQPCHKACWDFRDSAQLHTSTVLRIVR